MSDKTEHTKLLEEIQRRKTLAAQINAAIHEVSRLTSVATADLETDTKAYSTVPPMTDELRKALNDSIERLTGHIKATEVFRRSP